MTLVTAATSASTAQATNDAASSKLTADYNLFLKLLTTQMQNQDPMSPMDSSQYTQQLVQYSQVEQSIEQNKTLNSMLTSMNLQALTQSSSMIGQSVELNSDQAGVSAATPAKWNWTATNAITGMTATILDSKGNKIDSRDVVVSGTSGQFSWDGTTSSGQKVDDGVYQLQLTGTTNAGVKIKTTASTVGTVENVQMVNGAAVVSVNGAQYANNMITKIAK